MCKAETTRKTTHCTVYRVINEKAHSPLFFSLVFRNTEVSRSQWKGHTKIWCCQPIKGFNVRLD